MLKCKMVSSYDHVENIHQCFKKRLRSNLVLFTVKFSIKFPAWVNSFLISFVHGFAHIKYPVMFRSLKDFMRMGHIYRLTSGFSQTLKGWEKSCFSKNFRENQGTLSESKNREKSGIFWHESAFLIFLLNYLCFIYILYIMFCFLFYLTTNNE